MAELSGNQLRFIAWLLDPRPQRRRTPGQDDTKGTQTQFAEQIGVNPASLTKWKQDPAFRAAWERKHQELTGGIAMYSAMLEQLRQIAMGEDRSARAADRRSAIMNYLELTGRFAPKKTIEIKDPALVAYDDEALAAIAQRRFKVIQGAKAANTKPRRAARSPRKTA